MNVALMSYYAPIVGWILYYTVHSLLLTFFQPGFTAEAFWTTFPGSPALTVGMHTLAMILTAGVLFFGIRRGIERVVRWMFLALVAVAAWVLYRTLRDEDRKFELLDEQGEIDMYSPESLRELRE